MSRKKHLIREDVLLTTKYYILYPPLFVHFTPLEMNYHWAFEWIYSKRSIHMDTSLVTRRRFELRTPGLKVRCSTN